MPKYSVSDRLKQIMSERNLKQVDILNLAKPYCEKYKIKIGRNDLSQYISKNIIPRQNKFYVLAKALNVNEAWLMGYDVDIERHDTETNETQNLIDTYDNIIPIKTQKVPLLGEIACGEPIVANREHEVYVEATTDIHADYAVKARGDSMINARIYDGDIVFIREQPDVENGEIAAVVIEDEITLKRVYKDTNSLELRAENPRIRPLIYRGEELNHIRILGKAIAFQSDII